MPDYPYEGQLIADPVTFQRAVSAQITVYDAADLTNTTPLALKDASGLPTANPLTSSSDAFVKPIYAPSQDIKYVGAGLTVFVSSAKGMRDAAEAAAGAAQEAANSAVVAAADRVTTAAVDGAGKLILTKASGATVDAGNVKGVTGAKGDKGDKGTDGANVLPTDDAIEQAILTGGTKTKAALSATILDGIETDVANPVGVLPATFAKVQKFDNGGTFLKHVRNRVLGTEMTFPNAHSPYVPVWVSGLTVYATGMDSTLRKSTDGGKTWTKRGYNAWGFGSYSSFLKLGTGTLLNISSANPPTIQRSTDDGATWSTVHTYRTSTVPLGAQSWCIDPNTGHLYMGEYNTSPTADIALWKSTNDGLTWSIIATWPGDATPGNTVGRIRHIHSVQWDTVANRAIISIGDSTPDTGLWRTDAAGTGVERIVVNSMLPAEDIDAPRSIGVMIFPDYIAWAGDTTQNPYVYRIARTQIGLPSPVIEKVPFRLSSAAWFTVKASDDGSSWVLSCSEEGVSLDNLVHLYAVEDQGATVSEIGAIPAPLTSPAGAFQPVGVPEQGETFHMVTRGFGESVAFKFRLGKGLIPLQKPNPLPACRVTFTVTSPVLTLAPLEEKVFAIGRAGGLAPRLHIFETSIYPVDLSTATAGSQTIRVRKQGQAHVHAGADYSERYTSRQELGGSIANYLFAGGDVIEFYIRNNSATATTVDLASITYGWSQA